MIPPGLDLKVLRASLSHLRQRVRSLARDAREPNDAKRSRSGADNDEAADDEADYGSDAGDEAISEPTAGDLDTEDHDEHCRLMARNIKQQLDLGAGLWTEEQANTATYAQQHA